MKFKLFSAVLLLVCFLFLGVLSGVIPVTGLPDAVTAGLFPARAPSPQPSAQVTRAPEPSPSAPAQDISPVLPEPKAASTRSPYTPVPAVTFPTPSAVPTEAAVTPAPTEAPTASPEPEPTVTPEPTASPEPTAAPTAAPEAASASRQLWEPDAAVISTTITWNDPLRNDTGYDVDAAPLLDREPDLDLSPEGYQVLIIHTHGTEAFTPDGEDQYEAAGEYRTTDPDHSILKVGQALGQALEDCGLKVLVDTGLYDWPSYDGAYARSGDAIQAYLEEYPTIQVVIDLHRDAIGDGDTIYKTVSDQLQPDAAQMMFVVGTDATLSHPDWRENLAFAMSLQGLLEEEYPHLMRPALLSPNRYNQQLTPASVLLEIGAAGNTLREALTSAELFARAVGPALAARVGA